MKMCKRCSEAMKGIYECHGTQQDELVCAMSEIYSALVLDKCDLDGYKRTFSTEELKIVRATFDTIRNDLYRLYEVKK